MQNIAQHLLFARSTKDYLIFLDVLYITNAFHFHEVEKIVNHLPGIPIEKTVKERN